MNKYAKTKSSQLGMSSGKANNILKKSLLFHLCQELGRDNCVRCGQKIETVNVFTIDHITPWLYNDVSLFWDIKNIGFSHTKCNYGNGRRFNKGIKKHPSEQAYKDGCRCEDCREIQATKMKRLRKKWGANSKPK